jgi:hypothetical protein
MNGEARQRLNLRTIRETTESAIRHSGPDAGRAVIARANALLDEARRAATTAELEREIEAFRGELDQLSRSRGSRDTSG